MGNNLSFKLFMLCGAAYGVTPAFAQIANPGQQAASTAAPPAPADEQVAGDIVVTATRRETRLQTTAAAINAVGAAEMQARGITDVQSLTLASPGMSFGSTTMAQAHIAVRGIGSDSASTGQDPRIAYYQDGVYIGRPTSQLGGVFDLERIEVLKGPQGALYGRNATGGAVSVISKRPTDHLDGYLRASYGNYNALTLDSAAGTALSPTISARLALHYDRRDGFGKNIISRNDIDDRKSFGARLSLEWQPTPELSFLTIADYSRERDHAYGLHLFGQANPTVPIRGIVLGGAGLINSRDVASDVDPFAYLRSGGINETITYTGEDITVSSVFAYRKAKNHVRSDFDGTSLPLFFEDNYEKARQLSEELTISGKLGQFDWLVGALYFKENLDLSSIGPISAAAGGGAVNSIRQGLQSGGLVETTSVSPYFEFAYHLNDRVTLRAGGRYTYENKEVNDLFQFDLSRPYSPSNPLLYTAGFPRDVAVSYTNFVPSATVEWKATSRVFLYAKYAEGFKSGSYNISTITPPFRPEKIKSYEVGIKTSFPELRAVFNLTGFHYDYTDLQVAIVRGTTAVIENAASAKVNGVEAEARISPWTGFTIESSASYLDTKYKDFVSANPVFLAAGPVNLSGNTLTQAPKWSLYGSIQQKIDVASGSITARADANYTSRVYYTPFNEKPLAQNGYTLFNANVRYNYGQHWSIEAYIKNIGNKLAAAQTLASSGFWGFPVIGTLIPPRTFGARVGYTF